MSPLESVGVLIVGGVGLVAVRYAFVYSVKAVAAQIVKAINGQLGLTEIRDDVIELKGTTATLKLQFDDIEKQFEKILTDL